MSHTDLPIGLHARYQHVASRTTPNFRVLDRDRLVTVCDIFDAVGNHVSQGRAMLRPNEPFDPDIAHAVSLGRARKNLAGKFYAVEIEEARSG